MSVNNYFEEARGRAQRRKSPWNLLLIPFAIAGMIGAYFLLLQGVIFIQNLQIPKDVILFGNTRVGSIFKYVSLMFAAVPWGFIIANCIAFTIRPAREILDREAKGHKGTSFKEANNLLFKAGIVVTLLTFPLSVAGAMNYFYVTSQGITKQSFLSQKQYLWQDIRMINVACYMQQNRSSWELVLNYRLHMIDGADVDLWEENYDRFAYAYNQIDAFLKDQKNISYQSKITADGLSYLESSRYKIIRPVMHKIMQENGFN